MDKELIQQLSKDQKTLNFVQSDDWRYIRGRFVDEILRLLDITELDEKQDDAVFAREMRVRKLTAEKLMAFINSVEGDAEQAKLNMETIERIRRERFIQEDQAGQF